MTSLTELLQHRVNRAAWREFHNAIAARPRTSLYHYTSLTGLHGIVSSGTLWASDAEFLNDTSELRYARSVITAVAEEVKPKFDDDVKHALQVIIDSSFTVASDFDVFVCSFSERDDLLGQWVGYTPSAAGVSIGIAPSYFNRAVDATVRRVIYAKQRQRAIVKRILHRYAAGIAEDPNRKNVAKLAYLGGIMGLLLYHCALSFKDAAFDDEREWRLVIFRTRRQSSVKYRVSGSALVPYVEVSLSETTKLPIRRVVLGPGLDALRNAKSVKDFLHSARLNVPVIVSRVPYRNVR